MYTGTVAMESLLENRIATGVKITALDYNENGDIIYFGTVNGDIGFIKYKSDNKNQPVFQNSLYSKLQLQQSSLSKMGILICLLQA